MAPTRTAPSAAILAASTFVTLHPSVACVQSSVDPELASRGLHGYIASRAERVPAAFHYGAGFYASVWPLISRPIAGFQIGLPSTWILPDNSDNTTEPLCPPGTLPRDSWP